MVIVNSLVYASMLPRVDKLGNIRGNINWFPFIFSTNLSQRGPTGTRKYINSGQIFLQQCFPFRSRLLLVRDVLTIPHQFCFVLDFPEDKNKPTPTPTPTNGSLDSPSNDHGKILAVILGGGGGIVFFAILGYCLRVEIRDIWTSIRGRLLPYESAY